MVAVVMVAVVMVAVMSQGGRGLLRAAAQVPEALSGEDWEFTARVARGDI